MRSHRFRVPSASPASAITSSWVARQDARQNSRGAGGAAFPSLPLADRAERGAGSAHEFLLRQAASRRRPWRDRGQIVGQQLCLHVQIVFGLHVHEPLWIDLEETAEA